jgi:signal peptidase I
MTLNWFLSRKVRVATHMYKHVQKILNAQRDLLSPEAIRHVEKAIDDLKNALVFKTDKATLATKVSDFETVANKWLKPYPSAGLRENVEVLLVAIAVAMGIRTFFLQPFKIPTGSMQPTLYGITPPAYDLAANNFRDRPDVKFPDPVTRFFAFWYRGISYTHKVATASGKFEIVDEEPVGIRLVNVYQRFRIGGNTHWVWFPPDSLWHRAGLRDHYGNTNPRIFNQGEDVIKLRVISGDHLFVDRLTYNFRPPRRGEIIVFETRGITALPQDQFYIKRMVAMDGEKVRIGDDRHLVINGKRLDASVPHFEHVYSFDPSKPPMESVYSGHLNSKVAAQYPELRGRDLAPKFTDGTDEETVQPGHYMVMGDNTVNSSDSRTWGDFPRENVIGKSFFVYWPIGSQDGRDSRFGWGHR